MAEKTKKIKAVFIVEVAGKPPEHVKESMINHVETLKKFKNINLVKYNVHEPKEIENTDVKGMYTAFAEVEIEAENFISLMDLVFDFMPSSIEILSPYEFNFQLSEATMILNRLAGRMHRYDELAKIASLQTQQAEAQLRMILEKIQEAQKRKKNSVNVKFGEDKEEEKKTEKEEKK